MKLKPQAIFQGWISDQANSTCFWIVGRAGAFLSVFLITLDTSKESEFIVRKKSYELNSSQIKSTE